MGLLSFFAALLLSGTGPAHGSVVPMTATMELGSLSQFNQVNSLAGSLVARSGDAHRGLWSAEATYNGGIGNAYARGLFNVAWNAGDDVWYRSAFFLPVGFKAAMQGQVALMRWDNWRSHPTDTDHGGIVLYGSSKRAYLVRERLTLNDQRQLIAPFDLPEGRWFMLEVHQRFATDSTALNEVYLDGRLIGRSSSANIDAGRSIERVRYGIVAIAAGSQTNPLSLRFDDAAVDTTGPLASAPAADPVPVPVPVPAPAPAPAPGTPAGPGTIDTPGPTPPNTAPGSASEPSASTESGTVISPGVETATPTPAAKRSPRRSCARLIGKRRASCRRALRRAAARRRAALAAHQRA